MRGEKTMIDNTSQTLQRINTATIQRVLVYLVLVCFLVVFLLPIEIAIVTSLKTRSGISETLPYMLPGSGEFTLENWKTAFEIIHQGLLNSLVIAVPVAVVSSLMASLTAYGLTQTEWRGKGVVVVLLVAAIFLPPQAAVVPLSKLWTNYLPLDELLSPVWVLPLLESHHGDLLEIMITTLGFGLPINIILFRSFYKKISTDMLNAAKVDGASFFRQYRRIIFPLSGPMFAVTIVYQFTQVWNAFLLPLIVLGSNTHPAAPATLSLVGMGQSLTGTDFGLRMAGALLTALPTLLVFLIFGEQFAKGVSGGT